MNKLSLEDFPSVLPIFPLSGVLLLPHGKLPLNIFEPRYLQMIEDSMSSHRMIGMVQPINSKDIDHIPRTYPTGCLGKITSFSEVEDNRYYITLTGIVRFKIINEMPFRDLLYRQVNVSYTDFQSDLLKPSEIGLNREILLPALKNFFKMRGLSANWDVINQSNDSELLVSLAMICPFSSTEKQALLECSNSETRSEMLLTLIEMAQHETRSKKGLH